MLAFFFSPNDGFTFLPLPLERCQQPWPRSNKMLEEIRSLEVRFFIMLILILGKMRMVKVFFFSQWYGKLGKGQLLFDKWQGQELIHLAVWVLQEPCSRDFEDSWDILFFCSLFCCSHFDHFRKISLPSWVCASASWICHLVFWMPLFLANLGYLPRTWS